MWVSLSDKHVYYVLRKFAKDGLVIESEERKGNMPPRKVYEITEKGRQTLKKMLRAPSLSQAFLPAPFDAVVGILGFTDVVDKQEALEILQARRDALIHRLTQEHPPREFSATLESMYGFLATSLFVKSHELLTAEIRWLDMVIERVSQDDWESLRVPKDYLDKENL